MEVESKYIAPRSDAFVALMQAPELAGFHLEPLPPAHLHDVYLDTVAADLLRHGYAFRVREQGGDVLATLKSIGAADGMLHRRLEIEAALGGPLGDGGLRDLPAGPLREALDDLVGDAPLQELTRLRQYRTPRVAFDGPRLAGVLSLDVVAHEAPGGLHVSNEVEVELAEAGREEDLYRLDPVLRARGFEPVSRSKFERAVMRLRRGPDDPLLLLPDERVALEAFADDGTPLHRRRARVVLLAARDLRPATIANKVGLSASRVNHWVDAFRERRMSIFDADPTHDLAFTERRPSSGYRVSELVTAGTPKPMLFRGEHFDEGAPEDVLGPDDAAGRFGVSGSWTGGDGELAPLMRVREESLEAERVPAERLPAEAAPSDSFGDGAPTLTPEPPVPAAESPASPEEDPEGDPDDDLSFPLRRDAGGLPPVTLDRLVPEDVGRLDELLDLFEGTPVATPRLGREGETVGISLIEAEPPLSPSGSAPADGAFDESAGAAATEPDVPSAPGDAPAERPASAGARPTLGAGEPVLAAAERVLRHARDYLVEATARLEDERDAAAVRRALVAAHRVRIGLELFEGYLPVRLAQRLHRGLRPTARALDALGDLDLVRAHVASARDEAEVALRPAFAPSLEALDDQREAALAGVLARLRGAAHAGWLARYDRLLARLSEQGERGPAVGDDYAEPPDDYLDVASERPARDRLYHVLGSALWARYEALRAYDAVARSDDPGAEDLLYPLGVACSALQYVLGLASGCTDGAVQPTSRTLAAVERHLVMLHHARRAADALAPYAYVPPVLALRRRLESLADEARAEVPARWAAVTAPSFREGLGHVVVSIGEQ